MGRPPLALGTAGAIRYYKTATGYRARVLVRDYDGHVPALERRPPSKIAAERALKLALRDRTPTQARGEPTADSRVTALAEAWFAGLGGLSPITRQAYRDRLDRQLLPRLGELRIRELSVGTLDRHLRGIADTHGQPPPGCAARCSRGCARWPPPATTRSPRTRSAPSAH